VIVVEMNNRVDAFADVDGCTDGETKIRVKM
jgi:hypothetical protein